MLARHIGVKIIVGVANVTADSQRQGKSPKGNREPTMRNQVAQGRMHSTLKLLEAGKGVPWKDVSGLLQANASVVVNVPDFTQTGLLLRSARRHASRNFSVELLETSLQ